MKRYKLNIYWATEWKKLQSWHTCSREYVSLSNLLRSLRKRLLTFNNIDAVAKW